MTQQCSDPPKQRGSKAGKGKPLDGMAHVTGKRTQHSHHHGADELTEIQAGGEATQPSATGSSTQGLHHRRHDIGHQQPRAQAMVIAPYLGRISRPAGGRGTMHALTGLPVRPPPKESA